jgi:methylated-DNA-[protein]-cysteine S-methyltransferase
MNADASILSIAPARLQGLTERLAADADAEGLVDVGYRTVESPVGSLLLAATPIGLVRIAYPAEGHDDVLQALSDGISPRVLRHPARLDAAARQLDEYFAGGRQQFDLALDWRLAAGFRGIVLHLLPEIPYGHIATYGDVAAMAGRPRANRAVGSACATNPLPVVVPCHRVVRSDGALGGYLGGVANKAALLALEAA